MPTTLKRIEARTVYALVGLICFTGALTAKGLAGTSTNNAAKNRGAAVPNTKVSGQPDRLLFVGITAQELNPFWTEALNSAGWTKVSFSPWERLTPALLGSCRMVIMVNLPRRAEVLPADQATVELLADYVSSGGGLLLNQQQSGGIVPNVTLCLYLAQQFGTQILWEKVISDPNRTVQIGGWPQDKYTFTDQVYPPLNAGVRGVLYHSYVAGYRGVMPFLAKAPWRVALSAGPNSSTEVELTGLQEVDQKSRKQGFAKDVPLAGVRDFGRGRVGYIGIQDWMIFFRKTVGPEAERTLRAYMMNGWQKYPSDLLKFYLNAFEYLSAHSDRLASVKLVKKEVESPPYTTTWKLHRGIIGPRTSYSSGTSSPDQYVQAAKSKGFDFIIFLEDFAQLKPGGFEKLKQDCRRLTTGPFLAVPGLTVENIDGNHEYIFGDYVKLPSAQLLSPDGKRLTAITGKMITDLMWKGVLLGKEHHTGWYLFNHSPYPHFDTREVDAMAVVTQEAGKTLERVPDADYGAEARNGQYLWPQALTLMKSADEIGLLGKGVYYTNVIGAKGTRELYTFFNSIQGRCGMHLFTGQLSFGTMFLTNGPDVAVDLPRGDTNPRGDIYNVSLQNWDLKLTARSPAGLEEIRLMDGDQMIRRWMPHGEKTFTVTTELTRERQKHLWVQVRDRAGREAVSRDIDCDSWLLRECQCPDRKNQLLYSAQFRPDKSLFFVMQGGDTAIPDKGPWNGRVRPVGCFALDPKLGVGIHVYDGSPENHPQARLFPYLVRDGQVPPMIGWCRQLVEGREGGPHVQPHRVVASSDVLIAERILDGVFPVDAQPVIHVWHTMYPVQPSRYLKSTARVYFYLVKVDGISAYLWDQSFELLQDMPIKPQSPYAIGLGTFEASTATERVIVAGGKVVDAGAAKARPLKTFAFNRGDYIGLLKSPFGSFAAYSLTDGLVLHGRANYEVGYKPEGTVLKAGTKVRCRILLVGMHRLVTDPRALAAKILTDYGLKGPAGYSVECRQGRVVNQEYLLQIDAGKASCFTGTLHGLTDLPGNLGSVIQGLNDRWSAIFQQQGKTPRTRFVPVEQGSAYAVLRAEDEGQSLFIGHPIVADCPEVVLNLARSKDGKSWQLEVHNPTDKELTVTVVNNPHVIGFTIQEKMKLAPGQSVFRKLDPTEF